MLLWIYLCAIIAAIVAAAQEKINNPRYHNCRTRFTFCRPTPENAVSILFGVRKGSPVDGEKCDGVNDSTPPKIPFNHGD